MLFTLRLSSLKFFLSDIPLMTIGTLTDNWGGVNQIEASLPALEREGISEEEMNKVIANTKAVVAWQKDGVLPCNAVR